jgi:anti-sigma B factor antagonist
MFDVKFPSTEELEFYGRLDASQADKADHILEQVTESRILNFQNLEYISSAGLGILLAHQKRLKDEGHALKIINPNKHIRDVFTLTGFDMVFEIG